MVERCPLISIAILLTGTFAFSMSSITRLSRKPSTLWSFPFSFLFSKIGKLSQSSLKRAVDKLDNRTSGMFLAGLCFESTAASHSSLAEKKTSSTPVAGVESNLILMEINRSSGGNSPFGGRPSAEPSVQNANSRGLPCPAVYQHRQDNGQR